MRSYSEFFKLATSNTPYPFQERLAIRESWPSIARIPTGLGKTEATILAWLWHRLERGGGARRLIYVLPLRALVEQTAQRIELWQANLKEAGYENVPSACKLLGGDVASEWIAQPQQAQILIGTQDLLLSRALNRGYAMSRRKWPMAFALMHNDSLWVIDEVQLQGIGATTASQLQGFRDACGTFGSSSTIFVSATLDRRWINTVDHVVSEGDTLQLEDDDQRHPRISAVVSASKQISRITAFEPKDIAREALDRHRPGSRTIIVLNRVKRAVDTFIEIQKRKPKARIVLLHSRFRSADRADHLAQALEDPLADGTIVVATQVVEAGLDITSSLLISDLAPWSSMVQRFGRCNRRGDIPDARVLWCAPPELSAKVAAPYDATELEAATDILVQLEGRSVAPSELPTIDNIALPRGSILRKSYFFDLFDTSPDLSGGDLDVSAFIRPPDNEFAVSVFWRDESPTSDTPPRRDELCSVPRDDIQKVIKERAKSGDALVPDPMSREYSWIPAPSKIRIGDFVWLRSRLGGYTSEIGFESSSQGKVPPVAVPATNKPEDIEDDADTSDTMSMQSKGIVTLEDHSNDAATNALQLTASLRGTISQSDGDAIVEAARWHDLGKVHATFQETMLRAGCPSQGGPWAKSMGSARHRRPQFRHELASALGWLASRDDHPQRDLIAYLIAAHHGILRLNAYHVSGEDISAKSIILGVENGDHVVSASVGAGRRSIPFDVDLSIFNVGGTPMPDGTIRPTWGDRVAKLCYNPALGPFRLAFLETLVRVADWRASANPTISQGQQPQVVAS